MFLAYSQLVLAGLCALRALSILGSVFHNTCQETNLNGNLTKLIFATYIWTAVIGSTGDLILLLLISLAFSSSLEPGVIMSQKKNEPAL